MDIQLPDVNGLELTRKIKNRHPQIISVIFTGYDSEYREAARQSADYFLSKRSTSEDVFKLIENIWKTFKEMPVAPAKPKLAKKEKK
jgi:DNA-binding NarL/FixJ family response regulator